MVKNNIFFIYYVFYAILSQLNLIFCTNNLTKKFKSIDKNPKLVFTEANKTAFKVYETTQSFKLQVHYYVTAVCNR